MIGRSALLGPLALLLACAAAPSPDPASPAPPSPSSPTAATSPRFAYAIEELAPGVHAFIEPYTAGGLVSGNSLVVIGDDGVLVVDTGHFPSLARKMVADIRRLTDKPVRYVVTTHWHPDHLFGNGAFRAAFPDATFLAHAETRRLAIAKDGPYVDAQRKTAKYVAVYRQALATGKLPSGTAVTPGQRAELEATIPSFEQTVGDSDVTLAPPTTTFTTGVTLRLGSRVVEVMHLGRGNTAGDAVVYVPDAKVLATGDVVVAPTPYAYGSYFGEWLAVLKKIDAIDARAIVPGHGPVMRDRAYVQRLETLVASVRSQAAEAASAGLSLEATRAKIDLSAPRRAFAGDDATKGAEFDVGFAEPGVERAYQEAKGTLSGDE